MSPTRTVEFFPIERDVKLSELRAQLRKKDFHQAANAPVSQIRLSWTANADDCVRLPDASSDDTIIPAGSYVTFDVAA